MGCEPELAAVRISAKRGSLVGEPPACKPMPNVWDLSQPSAHEDSRKSVTRRPKTIMSPDRFHRDHVRLLEHTRRLWTSFVSRFSTSFVVRIKHLVNFPKYGDEVPLARRLVSIPLIRVLEAVVQHFEVDPASLAVKHSKACSRDVAAWLARRLTTSISRELTEPFGLGRPYSVRNLVRRAEQAMQDSPKFPKEVDRFVRGLRANKT